jgi:hypothetical protein
MVETESRGKTWQAEGRERSSSLLVDLQVVPAQVGARSLSGALLVSREQCGTPRVG